MTVFLVFLSVFIGLLLFFWGLQYVANWLFRLSKWIEKKTGNSTLAWNGPLAVLMALVWSGYAAWIFHVVSSHK